MSELRIPRYIVIEDERAAYLARYHQIVPEGDELKRIITMMYGGRCACCGFDDPGDMTVDHITPIKGGSRRHHLALWRADFPQENLQLLCSTCNRAKGAGRECPHATIARHVAFTLLLMIQQRGNHQ